MEKKIIITTSWDDGHPLDLRLADLLEKYSLKGTFYVPLRNSEHDVMDSNMLMQLSTRQEIGAHTVNHIYLNRLGDKGAKYEISNCKPMLEDITGKQVTAFCYPGGKYSQRDIDLVNNAGFLFGRTTKLLRTNFDIKSKLMNTSVQAYNHSGVVLIAHSLKNNYLKSILDNTFFVNGHKNFIGLVEDTLERLSHSGGLFHLWGHSWEIQEQNLWNELETTFKFLSNVQNAEYLNNSECWRYMEALDSV